MTSESNRPLTNRLRRSTRSRQQDGEYQWRCHQSWRHLPSISPAMTVKHVDGPQLQRVGAIPYIHVRPTLKGIRASRDLVLAR